MMSGLKFKMKIDSQSPSAYPQYSRYNTQNNVSNNNSSDLNKISSSETSMSNNNNPTSSTSDLTICIDNNEQSNNPNLTELFSKLSNNLELDSAKKQLELEEKRIQISLLQDEKLHKSELNKHELLQKNLDLKKKTSELEFSNKLRDLLIEAINNGDFHKCSYLNLCLNNQNTDTTSLFDITSTKNALNNLNTNQYLNSIQLDNLRNDNEYNGPDSIMGGNMGSSNGADEETNQYNNMDNFSDEHSYIDEGYNNSNLDTNQSSNCVSEITNQFNYEENENDNGYDHRQEMLKNLDPQQLAALSSLGLDKQLSVSKNAPYKLNTYLLGNRNIRHMICSSNKLEEYSNSAALKILFKGKCTDNDMCRRKEVHTHYLIDTTDCRRHISLYFQSSKYGLKFFKTYQIKSQGELEKIIRTFKMKFVN